MVIKSIAAFCCGAMFMLAEYGTYSASYMAFWGKFKEPEWILLAAGTAISLTGLSLGVLLRRLRLRSKYRRIRPLKGTDGNETNIDNRRWYFHKRHAGQSPRAGGIWDISRHAAGLTELQTERLFDRFYTVNTARKSTGLGLAIARTLTEKMGMEIGAVCEDQILKVWVRPKE